MKLSLLRPRRAGTLAVLVLGATLVVGASSAQAAVTQSSITTPADGSLLFQNRDSNPNQTFTVSGTTDASGPIDIACYQGSNEVTSAGPFNVSGTSFSFSVPQSTFAARSCHLVAIPDGSNPSSLSGFSGPRVGFSDFATSKVGGSGPNSADAFDYGFSDSTLTAESQSNSIDDCGPYSQLIDGTTAMNAGADLLYCAGSFFNAPADFGNYGTEDLKRSEIQVDGQNAYGSDSAKTMGYTSDPGFPALTATLDNFNTSNGDAQVTESESLVKCAPNNVYGPGSSDCSSFAGSGVSLSRVTKYTDNGRVQTVSDTYSSTDGAGHNLSLLYETDLNSLNAGWELAGQSGFVNEPTGATGPQPSAAPGTVYAIDDTTQSPSLDNPVGALTFASPYNGVKFDNTLWSAYDEVSALFDYERTVKPGAPVTITWSYATEPSLAQAQSDATSAQSALAAPAVKISSPKKNSIVATKHETIKGTASAPSGVSSVTVNGVAAKLSGSSWKAVITLNKGKNTVTAVAASKVGTSSQTSENVTYGPVVKIASSRGHYRAGKTKIKLDCAGPSGSKCQGTLTLTKNGHRLGKARYKIKTGHHKLVKVSVPRKLSGKVHAKAKATVKHGATAKRKVTLVP